METNIDEYEEVDQLSFDDGSYAEEEEIQELGPKPKPKPFEDSLLYPKATNYGKLHKMPSDSVYGGDRHEVNEDDPVDIKKPSVIEGHELEYAWDDVKEGLLDTFKSGDEDSKRKAFDTLVYLNQGDIENALRGLSGVSEEGMALVNKVIKEKGLPKDYVIRHLGDFKLGQDANRIYETLLKGKKKEHEDGSITKVLDFPYTATWLLQNDNLAMVKNETGILAEYEKLVKRYEGNFLTRSGTAIAQGVRGVGKAMASTYEAMQRMKLQSEIDFYEDNKYLAKYDKNFDIKHQAYIDKAKQDVLSANEFKNEEVFNPIPMAEMGTWQDYVYGSLGVAAQVGASLALGVVAGPLAGASFMGQQIFGHSYDTLIEKDIEHEDAVRIAGVNSLVQGIIEYVPVSKFFKLIKTKGFKNAVKKSVEYITTQVGTEWLQSFPDAGVEILGATLQRRGTASDFVSEYIDKLPETSAQGFKEGLYLVPYTIIPSTAKVTYNAANSIRNHIKEVKVFESEEALLEQTKLRELDPLAQEEYIEGLYQQYGFNNEIFLPFSQLDTFFQKDVGGLEKFLEDLGVTTQQIQMAKITNMLPVSRAKFLTKHANGPVSQALKDQIIFNTETLTTLEKEQLQEDLALEYERAKQEYAELVQDAALPIEAINMRDALVNDFKMDSDTADQNMIVFMSLAKVMSKRTGEDLNQWFNRINPVVKVGGKGEAASLVLEPDQLLTKFLRKEKVGNKQVPVFNLSAEGLAQADRVGVFPLVENKAGEITLIPDPNVTSDRVKGEARGKLVKFNSALVPVNTDPALLDILKKNNIGFVQYDPSVKGSKKKAFKELQKVYPEMFFQRGRGGIKGATTFTDTATYILLFDSANYSTFIHESFHVILNDMQKIVESGKANAETMDALDRMTRFAGGQLDTKGIEKLARGFEAYLREGKAPSIDLVDPFTSFSKWLKAIYKNVRELKVKINPEIRGVFERMLASEGEIQEAQEYYSSVEEIHEILDIEDAKKQKLREQKARAKRTALDIQTSKLLDSFLKAVGGREAFKQEATKIAQNVRAFNLMEEVRVKGGLDYNEVLELMGESYIEEIRKRHGNIFSIKNSKEGGLSTIEYALQYGYESDIEMLEDLINTKSFAKTVQDYTNQLIKERENQIIAGIKANEVTEGDESFHNDDQLAYQIALLEVMRDKIEKEAQKQLKRVELKAIQDAASQRIGEMPLSQATRYSVFSNAQKRHAKDAVELMKKGLLIEAYEALRLQTLNHAMVRESIKARDNRTKIERRYKTKKIKAKIDSMENLYADAITDMLRFFRVNTELDPAKDSDAINDVFFIDQSLEAITPDWIMRRELPEEYESYRDLSYQQFTELDETLQSLIKFGSDELMALKDQSIRTVEAFVENSKTKMGMLKNKELADEGSSLRSVQDIWNFLEAEVKISSFLADRLDNYSYLNKRTMGPMLRLVDTFGKADVASNNLRKDIADRIKPHMDTLLDAISRIEKMNGVRDVKVFQNRYFDIKGVPFSEEMSIRGKNKWTAERMVSFLLNLGNEGNTEALLKSYGFNLNQINLISSQFSKKELQAVQAIWDSIDALYSPLDEVYFRMFNRHLDKVEGRGIQLMSSDGVVQLKGGYYPLIFDHSLSDKGREVQASKDRKPMSPEEMNRKKSVLRKTKPKDSMTHTRTGSRLPPKLSLSVLFTHISDSARYITTAELLRDANRIASNKTWANRFKDKAGTDMYRAYTDWLSSLAGGRSKEYDRFESIFDQWQRLASINILGANLTVGLKQRLSVFPAIKQIGWKDYFQAMADLGLKTGVLGDTGNQFNSGFYKSSMKLLDSLAEKSGLTGDVTFEQLDLMSEGFLSARSKSYMREINDMMDQFKPTTDILEFDGKKVTKQDIQNALFWWINVNDMATVAPIYLGAYNKYIRSRGTIAETDIDQVKREARDYARRLVADTQPMSLPTDLSKVQRSNGIMKIFTMFSTYPMKLGNRMIYYRKAYKDGAIDSHEYYRHVAYDIVWPSMMLSAASTLKALTLAALGTGDEPEADEVLKEIALNHYDTSVSWIPFVRDVHPALKYYNTNIGTSPIYRGPELGVKAAKTLSDIPDAWDDPDYWMKAYWDTAKAIEFWAGVPPHRTMEDIMKNYETLTGEN